MEAATVIPFPVRRKPVRVAAQEGYFLSHEETTKVACRDAPGGRIVRIKKTFYDGRDRVEFAIERRLNAETDLEAFVAMLESAVAEYFAR